MMPKVITILLVVAMMAQYSKQDLIAAPVAAPAWNRGWGGWNRDWNYDGVVDWRDGWNGWNNGWNNGWRGDWGWNGAWDWNGDGIVDWRDRAWGGWRGNWGEPVVARRLGAKEQTASTLQHKQLGKKARAVHFLKNHLAYLIKQKDEPDISDEDLFKMFDADGNGTLTAQEIHDALKSVGEDISVDEIEKGMTEAGITNGRIDLATFKQLMTMQ